MATYSLSACSRGQLNSLEAYIQAMISVQSSTRWMCGRSQKISVLGLTISENESTGVSYSQMSSLTPLTSATSKLL